MARGDHIRTWRRGYWHHGIDCGDGTVIHYTGTPLRLRDAVVERCSMDEFLRGSVVEMVVSLEAVDPDAVIARAESRLGEKKYNLITDNCEHFASWCVTGRKESKQVQRTVAAAVVGGVVVVAGVVAAAAKARQAQQPQTESEA